MRDVDAPLVQQVLHVPQRERVADVLHDRQADDLGRGLEVAENAGVAHSGPASALPVSGKPTFPLTVPVSLHPDRHGLTDDSLQPQIIPFRLSTRNGRTEIVAGDYQATAPAIPC